MKKVIGGEISREEPRVIDLTKSLHVLDLRKPLPKTRPASEPQPEPKPEPPPQELPLEQESPLRAEGDSSEKAGVDGRDGTGVQEDHVRPLEDGSPVAPKRKRRLRPWPAKRILGEAAKAIILVAGAVFFLSLNIDLPERLIGIYFVASVVYAIDSQRTFLVALIFLVMVAGWSAFGQNVPAENYAIYAFYFLVIGLIAALRELVVHKPKPSSSPPEN